MIVMITASRGGTMFLNDAIIVLVNVCSLLGTLSLYIYIYIYVCIQYVYKIIVIVIIILIIIIRFFIIIIIRWDSSQLSVGDAITGVNGIAAPKEMMQEPAT